MWNVKYFFGIIGFLLLAIMSLGGVHAANIDALNVTLSTSVSNPDAQGIKIIANYNSTVINITRYTGDTSGNASVLNSSCGLIERSNSKTGDIFTGFNATLVQGRTYYILFGDDVTSKTRKYIGTANYTYNATAVNFTGGALSACGAGAGAYGFASITTNQTIPSVPITTYMALTANDTFNNTIINIFNATINGTFYNTTNGTINTNLNMSFNTTVNMTVSASNYFDWSYNNWPINTSPNALMTPYASIIGSDAYDNSTLASITVQFNGTNYTGTTTARVPVGNTSYNATVFSSNYYNYTLLNGNGTNQSTNVSMAQAYAYFNATEIISLSQLTEYNVSTTLRQGSDTTPLILKAGTYTINFNKTGWYNNSFTIIVPAITNQTYNLSGIYAYLLNITARNNMTGLTVTNYNVTITSTNYSNYTNSYYITTNGTAIPWFNDTNFNISIGNSTAIANTSVIANTSTYATPALVNITLSGFTTNTLFFNIYDEQTQRRIVSSTIINLVSNFTQYNFTTTTGIYNATLLNPSLYLITISSSGYFSRNYIYTLVNQTTAVQNVYLLNNSNTNTGLAVTFTTTDLAAIPLNDVLVVSQKLINTTYITISSQYTDFAGQAIASYDITQFYTVIFSKDGYITKSVTFKPVSTGYTVRLVGSTTSVFTSQLGDITYSFNPLNFTLPIGTYNFTFTTASPSASINSFGINYAGITSTSSGNTGGTVNITLNLSGANNNYKTYPFSYYIIDIYNNTFNFTQSYTIYNQSTPTNSSITQAIGNASFSTGGGIILAVMVTVVVLLVLSTFIAGAFLGVVIGILAITLSALTLIPWTFGIMIALIMFFAAWARGR